MITTEFYKPRQSTLPKRPLFTIPVSAGFSSPANSAKENLNISKKILSWNQINTIQVHFGVSIYPLSLV